jgi:hypothetical protein
MQITVRGTNGQQFTVRSGAGGSFAFKGLTPDRYNLDIRPVADPSVFGRAAAGVLVSARLGSADVLPGFELDESIFESLRITMSSAHFVSVTVHDPAGVPVVGIPVLLLSDLGRASRGTAGADGVARLSAIPGDSHLYIVPDECDTDVFQDPEWLNAHRNDFPPVPITAGASERITVTFRR